jgi:hypothetical protein
MSSLRASVSHLRTFTSCATEFPGTLRKPVATELTMFQRNNSVPLSSFVQAERLARVERDLVIKACMRGTMRGFAEWLRVLGVLSIRRARDLVAKRLLRDSRVTGPTDHRGLPLGLSRRPTWCATMTVPTDMSSGHVFRSRVSGRMRPISNPMRADCTRMIPDHRCTIGRYRPRCVTLWSGFDAG